MANTFVDEGRISNPIWFLYELVRDIGQGRLYLGIVTALVKTISILIGAVVISRLVDVALGIKAANLMLLLLFAGVTVFSGVVAHYYSVLIGGLLQLKSAGHLKKKLARKLTRIDYLSLRNLKSGDLLSRFETDTDSIAAFVGTVHIHVERLLFRIGGIVFLALSDWRIALLTAAVSLFSAFLSGKISRPIEAHSLAYQEAVGEVTSLTADTIAGIDTVKTFGLREPFAAKVHSLLRSGIHHANRISRLFSVSISLGTMSAGLPQMICILVTGLVAARGDISPGFLAAYVTLLARLIAPAREIAEAITSVRKAMGVIPRLTSLLSEQEEPVFMQAFEQNSHLPAVSFRNVTFGFGDDEPTLRNVSFDLNLGERIAIVGRSGTGKTTIINLICGLLRPQPGAVFVNETDIARSDLASLRKSMAVVTQDTFLFPWPVKDNLSAGNKVSAMRIISAAKVSHAHDFIMDLPRGYNFPLSEFGNALSGGERQRLSLARAIVSEALDSDTKTAIIDALLGSQRDRSILIATHDRDIATRCDKILVIENGTIVEAGSHDELLRKGGHYQTLFAIDSSDRRGAE